MNSNSITRIRILLVFVFLFALVILGRLYDLQIARGEEFSKKANKQYIKTNSVVFDRGSIFFSSKDGEKVGAAILKDSYVLSINPKLIKNIDNVYDALSQYIDLDKNIFVEKASKEDDPYEEIFSGLSVKTGDSIKELRLSGVSLTKETWRSYPADTLAIHSIGLIGYGNGDKIAGRYGLERYYEDVLDRKSTKENINFFAELFAGIKDSFSGYEDKEGDLVLSVEPSVESYLEQVLSDTKDKWDSDSIGGIVMNPHTGEILALDSLPTFSPSNLSEVSDSKIFSNSLVEYVYEMGSIIKPLTMAVGLDSGAINPQSTYDDQGFLLLNNKKISNYDGRARGIIPMQEVLSQSLNVGASYIALKVGSKDFAKYFLDFGLGEKTGIDQPNEQKGIVKNLETGRDVETATASYGQGIAMTPIETVRSLAILANDGLLVTPHLVKKIEYSDGSVLDIEPETKRVLKEGTALDVTKMLVKVVDTALKGGEAKMDKYSIAAKTGTAQIADPTNGGYYSDRYLHSFFGYFPAYDPEFIVFLYHLYPKGAQYASETLTDPFMELTKFLINYYEIPPDR